MSNQLKDHILQTASELFYSHGIKATGIDTIVKASGIAKMSLYKYFPSKEDLVVAHLHKSAADFRSHLKAVVESRPRQPKDKLLAVFEVFTQLLSSPGFRGCPFINAVAEFADPGNPVQQCSAEFYRTFKDILSEFARQANISQTDKLSNQLIMLITGAMMAEQINPGSESMQNAYDAAVMLIESYSTEHLSG